MGTSKIRGLVPRIVIIDDFIDIDSFIDKDVSQLMGELTVSREYEEPKFIPFHKQNHGKKNRWSM